MEHRRDPAARRRSLAAAAGHPLGSHRDGGATRLGRGRHPLRRFDRNAAVTAVGGWSNKTYRTWTNNSGRYELGGLPTGEYTVTYRLGTRSATISGVHIDAQYDSLPWSVLTGVDARVE
jgi:hypothetical protein